MGLSLRDQLLKAGLVNEKQAKQVGKQQQKQKRLAHKGQAELDDSARQDRPKRPRVIRSSTVSSRRRPNRRPVRRRSSN